MTPNENRRSLAAWSSEVGHHPPRTGSRGFAALLAYEFRGPILFIGGPIGGKFKTIGRWSPVIYWPAFKQAVPTFSDDPLDWQSLRREAEYRLETVHGLYGSTSFAYVFRGCNVDDEWKLPRPEGDVIPDSLVANFQRFMFDRMKPATAFEDCLRESLRYEPPKHLNCRCVCIIDPELYP